MSCVLAGYLSRCLLLLGLLILLCAIYHTSFTLQYCSCGQL